MADRVRVLLGALQQPRRVEVLDHAVARLEALHAGVLAGVLGQPPVGADDVEHGQAVALPDVEVDGVVAGRDLQRAGPRLDAHRLVGDDRHRPVRGRHEHVAAEQVLVALVLGVHGDAGVGRDRLRPRGGDDQVLAGLLVVVVQHRIPEVPERAGLVIVLDLEVGERGAAVHAPVDDALAAVDEAVLVEVHERLAHGALPRLVHRERLALPVGRGPQPAVLLGDARARAPDEVPHALEERLAADVVPRDALGGQLALDERVDGDGGVVDAGQPERVVAEHAVPAHQRVLDGDGERVADVQLTGEVGRRHDHGERPLAALRAEGAGLLPRVVDALLHLRGVVGGRHLLRGRRGFGRHGRAPRWLGFLGGSIPRLWGGQRAKRRPAGAGRRRPARPSMRGAGLAAAGYYYVAVCTLVHGWMVGRGCGGVNAAPT